MRSDESRGVGGGGNAEIGGGVGLGERASESETRRVMRELRGRLKWVAPDLLYIMFLLEQQL